MKRVARLAEGMFQAVSMSFSWSCFYGVQMCLAGYPFFEGEDTLLAIVNALTVSVAGMTLIIPLDNLADAFRKARVRAEKMRQERDASNTQSFRTKLARLPSSGAMAYAL